MWRPSAIWRGSLERLGGLFRRCNRDAAYRDFLDEVRKTHKRKRNLMKMMNQKGW